MTLQEKELIQWILVQKHPNLSAIEEGLVLTREQVMQRIHSINNQLISSSIAVVEDKLAISVKCEDELYGLLIGMPNTTFNDDLNYRKSLIEIELMTQSTYHSLQSLAEQFFVSRNTMYSDLKQIKEELSAQQLQLNYSRKSGYQIWGAEYLLRNYLVQQSRYLLSTNYGKSCFERLHLIRDEDFSKIQECLLRIEKKAQIQLTDEQNEELPHILAVVMARVRCGPKSWSFKIERFDIRNTIEYPIIEECLKEFTFLKDTDVLYLSLHILSSNRIQSAFDFLNSEEIIQAIDCFVERIKNKLALRLIKETEFKEKLLLHVQPAIFRNLFGFRINNPLTHCFIREHREIYLTVAGAVAPFEQIVGHRLSDEEIVYLAMIVLGWLYQSEESRTRSVKAVVLCPNGTSVSKLLLENLRAMFPEIEFIGAYSFRQFKTLAMKLDLIFTTKPMESEIQTIVVPPFLEPEYREQLRETVSKFLKNNTTLQAKSAVKAIEQLLPKDKVDTAQLLLEDFFKENREHSSETEKQPTKRKIGGQNIVVIDRPVSWENCLDAVFAPMLVRKSIDCDYLNRCKRVFYSNYRQMQIGPDIYLPHTLPSKENVQSDVEIALFKYPVMDPEEHPLKLMVGLLPSKTNDHVPLLLAMNDLFLNHQSIQALMHAESISDVLKILEGGEPIYY
ncbi:MAG: BglG family transcription antiterminator [Sporolactobacillus sp.]